MSASEYGLTKSSHVQYLQGSKLMRVLIVAMVSCLIGSLQTSAQTQASCTFNITAVRLKFREALLTS